MRWQFEHRTSHFAISASSTARLQPSGEARDVRPLVAEVIEVEDDRIAARRSRRTRTAGVRRMHELVVPQLARVPARRRNHASRGTTRLASPFVVGGS